MEEKSQTFKSVAVLGSVLLLILLSAVIPARWVGGGSNKQQLGQKLELQDVPSAEEVAKDTNNDGVVSWKEVMKDTLNAPPETIKAMQSIPTDPKVIAELNDPDNLTADFSKNLYLTTSYLKQNGITDDASKQEALTKLLQNESAKIVPVTYSYKDISVAKNESKESIKVYGNAVASIIDQIITQKIMTDDLMSIQNFSKSKNEVDLIPLVKNKQRVDIIIKKLLALSVPPSAITYHILTLNRISNYDNILDNLSKASSDPIRATSVIDKYVDGVVLVIKLFIQYSTYFDAHNVVFSSNEKGYVFTVGYKPN